MTDLEMTPDDQRDLLVRYVNAPHVIARTDPFQRQWDELVAECLRREELALGCALMTLFALRSAGFQARAAGALMELMSARTMAVPKDGGGPNGKGGRT